MSTFAGFAACLKFRLVTDSSLYINALGGALWFVSLLGLSCSGNVVPPSNDFGDTAYAKFLCALNVLSWLWFSMGIFAEIVGRHLPQGVVMAVEIVITLFAFSGASSASSNFDGPHSFCSITNNASPCTTFHAAVAFTWYLFFLMLCKLSITYKVISRHRATAAINYRPNLDQPVSGPNTYAEAPSMASAWQRHTDQQTGMDYYFNVMTGESSWTKPDGL